MHERTKLLCEMTGLTLPQLMGALGVMRVSPEGWHVRLENAATIAYKLGLTAEQRQRLAESFAPKNEWERARFARFLTLRAAARLAGIHHEIASRIESGKMRWSVPWCHYCDAIGLPNEAQQEVCDD